MDKVLDCVVGIPWTISTYPHKSAVFFEQQGLLWAAVEDVSFSLYNDEVLVIAGESG